MQSFKEAQKGEMSAKNEFQLLLFSARPYLHTRRVHWAVVTYLPPSPLLGGPLSVSGRLSLVTQ